VLLGWLPSSVNNRRREKISETDLSFIAAPQNGQVTTLPLDAFRAVNWSDFERELRYSGILEIVPSAK
jgi:hypothetical protein